MTIKFNIVINFVLSLVGNHSIETDAYAFNINGLPIPENVYPTNTQTKLINMEYIKYDYLTKHLKETPINVNIAPIFTEEAFPLYIIK